MRRSHSLSHRLCRGCLTNIAINLTAQNRLAKAENTCLRAVDIALLGGIGKSHIFRARLDYFKSLSIFGQWEEAEDVWQLLDPMGRQWSRSVYRPGMAENLYARFLFWQGKLQEVNLINAEQLAKKGKDRRTIRSLHRLRGQWRLEQVQWESATNSFLEAVLIARAMGQKDEEAEAFLALTKLHLKQLPDPHHIAEQLASAKEPAHRPLAELWLAIGNHEQATKHALAAYKWAWADGEPYVHRYELNKARALLEQLNIPIPDLPPYDPAKEEKFPWEDELVAAIEELRAKAEAEKAADGQAEDWQ